jgi:agmatine/peptidylarginine deiminase
MRRLPAEWERQTGVMLTWPHADTGWADQLEPTETLYAKLAERISHYERVLIVCRDEAHVERVRGLTARTGAVNAQLRFVIAPSNDTWARDYGPISLLAGQSRRLLNFQFNGWGGKFSADLDTLITRHLAASGAFGNCLLETSELVLEGGAIETDGRGTLLAVTRTLVDPLRNPGWSRADIEHELTARLGIRHFLWLEHGAISGDDTDGHIDTLARFSDSRTICHAHCTDPSDADFAGLQAMEQELTALRDPAGHPYRLVPLPTPAPILDTDGARLPAGYANFLIINGAVLLPVYDDPADAKAWSILGGLFPTRKIIMLDCRPLIRRGGSLHCISMQLPAGAGGG